MSDNIKLSVHQLVDFLLRTGDIDSRVFSRSTMQEGSIIHSKYQKNQDTNYMAEYPLRQVFTFEDINITLEGRADGIIKKKDGGYIIDEIKSTVMELAQFKDENIAWHLGQGKCYALMFMKEQNLNEIDIRLTYIKQGKKKETLIDKYHFHKAELDSFIFDLFERYFSFYNLIFRKNEERNESINNLKFPFELYRRGQKQLSKYVYSVAIKKGRLFVEAPTGIGKTMSTLFPYIKTLPLDKESKIFYLTAKGSGKESAHQALNILRDKGLSLYSIIVTSKEKICFEKGKGCNPDECPFAKGYYSKIQDIIRYCLANFNDFTYDKIIDLATYYEICPFEFELDLSLFMDVIICDYNYLFDPISYMKRYFDEDASHFLVLVDEAHNLIDRSQKMYSASISEISFKVARKSLKGNDKWKIKTQFNNLKKMFDNLKMNVNDGYTILEKIDVDTFKTLDKFVTFMSDANKNDNDKVSKDLFDFYLEVNRFLKISELFSERYLYYVFKNDNAIKLTLFCLDTSRFLKNISNRVKALTYFSATLSPINYYVTSLGGDENDPYLLLSSPFAKNNLLVLVAHKVSIVYKNREKTYQEVVDYIKAFISNKIGNYFIYLPSYEYLHNIKELLDFDDVITYFQRKDMSDLEKEEFLSNFKSNPIKTTLGFVIIGGAFSEGIDLVSDRLIGAVIVGIGLPKINFESDEMAKYYDKNEIKGRNFAYLYPGMNKVMQALGRVIRSESDRGAVLLIDERYAWNEYRTLLRMENRYYKSVYSPLDVKKYLQNFFLEKK